VNRRPVNARTGQEGKNYIIEWAVLTFIVTFFLEALGTAAGAIFGEYQYGSTLGLHMLNVPVIIGINWILIILGMISWAERIFRQPVVIIFAAAFGTVLFDFIMEPVAMRLDYWNWTGGFIPLQNYAAWWLISLVFAALYKVLRVSCRNPLPGAIVLMQTVFFLVLRITIV
jgi:putative membrane protein